ncbi:MAG: hypothetical protein ACRERE_17975 [Candidatus Entotheonellia bacterium]
MDKLGLRELLRYGYTGVLCALVAAVVDGTRTEQLVKHLGDVLSPLAVLAVGTAVYLVFRTVVGKLFLWRLIDWSHAKAEDLLGRPATRCKVRYLQDQHGVPRGQGLDAYVLVRDSLLPEAERERFHVQHSESYILFVTAFVCGSVSLLAYVGLLPSVVSPATYASLGAAAVVALGAGLWHDIVLCRAERAAIGRLPREKVDATLWGSGFVADTKPAMTGTDGG